MKTIKKLLKSCVVACLLITGLATNPLNIKAEEAGMYGSVAQIETHQVTISDPIDEGFDLVIKFKLRRTNTGVEEILSYDSFVSTSITSGYTFAPLNAMSATGSSSSIDANKILKITYAVKTYKNGTYLGAVDVTITYKLNRTPTVTVG